MGVINIQVILLSGKADSGKNTVSDILRDTFGKNNLMQLAFADELKFICEKYLNWDGIKDETGRTILQKTGSEIREENPDFFVNIINEIIWVFRKKKNYFVLSDTRYQNEISVLQDSGYSAITVRIERPNHESGLTEEQKSHESEVSLDNWDFDYLIINDGTLQDLESKVDDLIKFMEDN